MPLKKTHMRQTEATDAQVSGPDIPHGALTLWTLQAAWLASQKLVPCTQGLESQSGK